MAEDKDTLVAGELGPVRIAFREIGTTGLSELNGDISESIRKELTWPTSINTYRKMYSDPLIYAAIQNMTNMIAKVRWYVKAPDGADAQMLKKADFIAQCMGDMEHSWESFIRNVMTMAIYGFQVSEKVYRRRNAQNGSKYRDNLIGWRKLAARSQRTIKKWKFSDDGRDLLGVYQDLSMVNGNRFALMIKSPEYTADGILIDRNRFMLFNYNGRNGNPEGESPLAACWQPWKFKVILEEQEAIGIARDLNGLPFMTIPAQYMAEDASPEDKKVYEYCQTLISRLQSNEQGGIILPSIYDERGNPLFKIELLGTKGNKQFDTDKSIKRYDDKILTALFSDILKLGQQTHGSFSLAGAKTNIVAVNIEARLKEISEVINQDLIKDTFRRNGWTDTELPMVCFEDLDEEDLDMFSKMVQRIAAVNMMPRSREIISQIVKRSGFDGWETFLEMPEEEFNKLFTDNETGAGEGMEEGMNSGTGTTTTENSDLNTENAA